MGTSSEAKYRWIKKAYKRYLISLRYDRDADLIDYLDKMAEEGHSASDIFKKGIKLIREGEK